jgi:hypothetical protein
VRHEMVDLVVMQPSVELLCASGFRDCRSFARGFEDLGEKFAWSRWCGVSHVPYLHPVGLDSREGFGRGLL